MKTSFDFRIFYYLTKPCLKPSTALLVVYPVYEFERDALDDYEWFPYYYDTETVIRIKGSATMTWRLSDSSWDKAGVGNIRASLIVGFPGHKKTSKSQRLRQNA